MLTKATKLTKAIDAITEESIQRSLEIIGAALEARFGASEGGEVETAWLIEWPPSPDLQPRWWHPVHGWTVDANRALRLVRREDAEALIHGHGRSGGLPGVATEHKWLTPAGRALLSQENRG